MMRFSIPIACCLSVVVSWVATGAKRVAAETVPIGVARMDVTPNHPVRLVGYANRKDESEGVAGRLWAKAMAIGSDQGDGPAILLTVDNCGVPDNVTEEVARRLAEKADIRRERLMVCSSHTHTGPWLEGFLPWHYSEPVPESHKEHIRRYTRTLTDAMVQVALDALAARQPGQLSWAQGTVGFAVNRRVIKDGKWAGFGVSPEGPVDHSLPVLCPSDAQGKLKAVVVNYACHCTTLTGRHNEVHGDWAGLAQQFMEQQHPDVVAMITIGCGADANP
ncbi:MAG: neutral/alkaline non-lysosomal ceramidase N-terminal domain-containing protein, partial [Pirellulaceae bacterium]